MKTVLHLTIMPAKDTFRQAGDLEYTLERVRRTLKTLLGASKRPESVDIKIEVPQ